MCLSVPAKIIRIEAEKAVVSTGNTEYEVSLQIIDDVAVGDYVLVHTGFAIQKISEEEAVETLKTFEEFKELNEELDNEENQTGQRIV